MNKKLLAYILIPAIGIPAAGTAGVVAASQVPAIQETNEQILEELENLKQQIEALQSQMTALQQEMERQISEVQQQYNAKINEINEQITALQSRIVELNNKLEDDKNELALDYNTKITNLQSYIDGEVEKLNKDIKANTTKIEELKTQHEKDKQDLENDYNTKITSLETSFNTTKINLENDYNSKIDSLKSETNTNISFINSNISALTNNVSDLTKTHLDDINGLINSYTSAINNAETEMYKEINDLRTDLTRDISGINEYFLKEIDDLEEALSKAGLATEDSITTQINALQSQIDAIEQQHGTDNEARKQEIASKVEELQAQITNLQSQLSALSSGTDASFVTISNQISELIANHNEDIQNAKDEFDEKLDALADKFDESVQTKIDEIQSDYNTKISNLNTQFTNSISNLQSQITQNKQDIEDLKTKEANDISTLSSSFTSSIADLETEMATQKTEIESDYNSKIEDLETSFQTEIDSLQSQIDADKAALVAFKDQYITEKAALEAALEAGLAELQADFDAEIATINTTITSLTNDIVDLQNDLAQAITDIQNDYNTKINSLISRISELEKVQYHTVTFNTNGGSPIASVKVKHGDNLAKPTNPTKSGYNFINWTCQGENWSFIGYVVAQDITLDANWSDPIKYTITYNLNGGTLSSSNPTSYTVESAFALISPTKTGYTFAGWKDQNNNSITSITKGMTGNKVLTASWTINYYSLTVTSNDSTRGTVTGSGTYAFGSSITVTATPKTNKIFEGWYYNNALVSILESYTFSMPAYNYSLVGKFVDKVYTISFETNGGTPISPITAEEGETINVITTKNGYSLAGWYTDSSLSMSSYFELGNTMPAYNGTLYAKWTLATYLITYHLGKNTTNNSSNPTSYTINDTKPLYDPTIQYGTFVGWYTDAEYQHQITQIVPGMYGNLDLYCKVNHQVFTITFETNGGNSISTLSYNYKDTISIPTPTKANNTFKGWYTDTSLTTPNTYKTMPAQNITLYAKWFVSADDVGMYTPFTAGSKTYMYFGSYPQSVVSDANVINELSKITTPNSNGYYEYNGAEYTKQITQMSTYNCTYSNGESAVSDQTRYFKVEPILWIVLSSDVSGNYTLLAECVLNAHRFDGSSGNYKDSEIRSWLNDSFYNQAFKAAEKGSIITTTVQGSSSVGDTQDNVYLFGFQEYTNTSYGFNSGSDRYCQPTDYALANYCQMNVGGAYDRNCSYWTRDNYLLKANYARYVNIYGDVYNYCSVSQENHGVRPAITINL